MYRWRSCGVGCSVSHAPSWIRRVPVKQYTPEELAVMPNEELYKAAGRLPVDSLQFDEQDVLIASEIVSRWKVIIRFGEIGI